MAKPLKFHQTLNLPPRSAKHGKHRRAGPAVHGHSIVGADYGAAGSDQGAVAFTHQDGTAIAAAIDTFRAHFAEPHARALPEAGIRAGEIIGHRLWWVIPQDGEQWLCSLAHRRLWRPGETIEGDIAKRVDDDRLLAIHVIWGGVYAFASADSLRLEIQGCRCFVDGMNDARRRGIFRRPMGFDPTAETSTFVSGTVKMWGDVVEHQCGYRAQFAKLHSLDQIFGTGNSDAARGASLVALRARYLPGCYPPLRRCTCGAWAAIHRSGCPVGDAIV